MGIQVAPRICFRQMHDMGLGKSLSYVFVLAYFLSQCLFCFCCGIQVASVSNVDSMPLYKLCSHISMGVLILLIIKVIFSIPSNRCAFLQVDPIISTFTRSNFSSSQWCLFHPSQVAFLFPPSHP